MQVIRNQNDFNKEVITLIRIHWDQRLISLFNCNGSNAAGALSGQCGRFGGDGRWCCEGRAHRQERRRTGRGAETTKKYRLPKLTDLARRLTWMFKSSGYGKSWSWICAHEVIILVYMWQFMTHIISDKFYFYVDWTLRSPGSKLQERSNTEYNACEQNKWVTIGFPCASIIVL